MADFPHPTSTTPEDTSGSWLETARQLRELRDEQRQTWGDLDSSTLGRYLSNEVDAGERAQVEAEMRDHPELARLTDLVRDILADFSPEESAPIAPPAILAPEPEPEPRLLRYEAAPRRPGFFARHRQHLALVAAACLLFLLGRQIIGDIPTTPEPELPTRLAMREPDPLPEGTVTVASLKPLEALDRQFERDQKSDDKPLDALAVASAYEQVAQKNSLENHPRFATSMNRVGVLLKEQGYIVKAEQTLTQSYNVLNQQCGQDNQNTRQAASNLANIYQLALNYNDEATGNPYFQDLARAEAPMPQGVLKGQFAPYPAPPVAVSAGVSSKSDPRSGDRSREWREVQQRFGAQTADKWRGAIVPVMVQALENAKTRDDSLPLMRALARVGPAANDATRLLLLRLRSTDRDEQQAAVQALGSVGVGMPDVVAALSEIAQQSPELGLDAGRSLLALGPDGHRAVAELFPQALFFRKQAAETRGEMGKSLAYQADVIDALQRMAADPRLKTGILDAACVFTPHILMGAHHQLDRLRNDPASQVFIETLRLTPPESALKIEDRAKWIGTRGLYLLLVAETNTLQIHVGEALRDAGMTAERERELKQALNKLVAARRYDEIPGRVLAALPRPPKPPTPPPTPPGN